MIGVRRFAGALFGVTALLLPSSAGADPAEALPDSGVVAPDEGLGGAFTFGSYGRAQIHFDEDGNRAPSTNVVGFGPRLFEASYAELDFAYELSRPSGFGARVQTTVALQEPLAHRSGDFGDGTVAVRNLYAEAWGFTPAGEDVRVWVGSRMYRGDDIYLFDWWPLDELNTLGGGVAVRSGPVEGRAHVGVNRLDDDYQLQAIRVPGSTFGSRERLVLDRQRLIGSLRLQYDLPHTASGLGSKIVLYSELHRVPEGERIPPELVEDGVPQYDPDELSESLPGEQGWVAGAQVGLFGVGSTNHLNLFVRYARGLAAYGEFGVPFGTAADGTAASAEELRAALSGNWETRRVGLLAGAYVRRFRDADGRREDPDDFLEGAVALRPKIFVTDHFHQGFELSWQRHVPLGLDPETGREETSNVGQLTVMEIVSLGRGSYRRPELRLTYTLSLLDEAARRRYPPGDIRRPDPVEHFVGLSAEWWFNSSRY